LETNLTISWVVPRYHKEKGTFQDVKEDIPFHVSNVFSPICLFHLFLLKASFLQPEKWNILDNPSLLWMLSIH